MSNKPANIHFGIKGFAFPVDFFVDIFTFHLFLLCIQQFLCSSANNNILISLSPEFGKPDFLYCQILATTGKTVLFSLAEILPLKRVTFF